MLRGNEEHNCSDVSGSSTSADHRTEVVPDMLRYSKAFELSVEKLRSNFRVPVSTQAAVFYICCSLLVMTFAATVKTALQ